MIKLLLNNGACIPIPHISCSYNYCSDEIKKLLKDHVSHHWKIKEGENSHDQRQTKRQRI